MCPPRALLALVPLAVALLAVPATAQRRAPRAPVLTPTRATAPPFVENRGQWPDEVLFLARTTGADVWVTADALVVDFYEGIREGHDPRALDADPVKARRRGRVVRARFEGGRARRATGLGQRAAYHNYLLGPDPSRWATRVPLYDGVMLEGISEGVDLRLYADGGRLRHALVVAPGADLARVRVRLEGAEGASTAELQALRLATPLGDTDGGERHAGVEAHPPAEESAGDALLWATYLGGTGFDYALGVAVDADERATIAGYTASATFPTTPGAYDASYNGGASDAFVTRLLADGSDLRWSTFLGGTIGYDRADAVALDPDGGAVVAGYTESEDFPTTPGAYDTSHNGGRDGFVARLSADGTTLRYATLLGGTGSDTPTAVAHGVDGTVSVAGYTGSPDFPVTSGAFDTSYNGSVEAFAARFTPDGDGLVFGTYLGGSSFDYARSAALGSDGSLTLTGETGSADFPTTPGAYDETYSGDTDAFVARLAPDGATLSYGTYLGGAGSTEWARAVSLGADGSAFVTGSAIGGPGFPVTPGAFDETYNGGNSDAFVARLASDGTALLYGTYLGGALGESAPAVAVAADGSAVVAGNTTSEDFPTTPGAYDDDLDGANDIYVARLSSDGSTLLYSTYLGGISNEIVRAAALGGRAVTVAGELDGPGFPVTPGAFDETYDGVLDAFAARLDVDLGPGNQLPIADAGEDQTVVVGQSVSLDGSGSFDPEGEPLTYAWTLATPPGSDATLSDATGAQPSFCADVAGGFTVTLVVSDGQDESGPDAAVVTALAPAEALDTLADAVAALGPPPGGDGTLNGGLVRALTNKLDQARRALDRGRPDLAVVHLAAFAMQVGGLQASGQLSAAQAAALSGAAEDISRAVTAPCSPEGASGGDPLATSSQAPPPPLTLHGARPNPSGAATTLSFDVAEPTVVRLSVYDMLGREMARLVEGAVEAGRHEIRFDASPFPNGVYLARLTGADGLSLLRRVTVLH